MRFWLRQTRTLQSSLVPELSGFFAGGHGEAVIPVPIPNTEVKRLIAEGSAGPARARVGRRRLFFLLRKEKGPPAIVARNAAIIPAFFVPNVWWSSNSAGFFFIDQIIRAYLAADSTVQNISLAIAFV